MSGRLISSDLVTKRVTRFHTDPDGGIVLSSEQDVTSILENAKENRNRRSGFKGDGMHHVGYIPLEIYEDWMRKGVEVTPELCSRWLDENEYCKTHPGRLSK